MDLSNLDTRPLSEQGSNMHVRHPVTDEPLFDDETGEPITICLLGDDSAELRSLLHQRQTRRIERAARTGNMTVTGEQVDADALEILCLATKSWQHIVLGQRLECNPHNARRLYTEIPWIREQAERHKSNRKNYLGNSSTT